MEASAKSTLRQLIEQRIEHLEWVVDSNSQQNEGQRAQLDDEATRIDALTQLGVSTSLQVRAENNLILLRAGSYSGSTKSILACVSSVVMRSP